MPTKTQALVVGGHRASLVAEMMIVGKESITDWRSDLMSPKLLTKCFSPYILTSSYHASETIHLHVFLLHVSISLGYISWSEISGLYNDSEYYNLSAGQIVFFCFCFCFCFFRSSYTASTHSCQGSSCSSSQRQRSSYCDLSSSWMWNGICL